MRIIVDDVGPLAAGAVAAVGILGGVLLVWLAVAGFSKFIVRESFRRELGQERIKFVGVMTFCLLLGAFGIAFGLGVLKEKFLS